MPRTWKLGKVIPTRVRWFLGIAGAPFVVWVVLGILVAPTNGESSDLSGRSTTPPHIIARLTPPNPWAINHIAYMSGAHAIAAVAATDSPIFLHGTLEIRYLGRRHGWTRLLDDRRLACRPPKLELLVPTAVTADRLCIH